MKDSYKVQTKNITTVVPDENKSELPKNEEAKSWPQVLAILIGSLAGFTAGMLLSWSSPSIPRIINDKVNYNITLDEASYFTVLPPLASISSSFLFSKLNDIIGRKYTILFMAVPYSLTLILIATTTSLWTLYLARIINGIGDACLFASLPIYISEISTPQVRGTWGNSMTFFIYLGEFMINVIGSYLSVQNTAYLCLVFPVIFGATFIFMPESPYYLIMKNRHEEARASLQNLRRLKNVDEELERIQKDVARQLSESGTWKDLFTIKSNRKALYAGIFLRTTQQLAGTGVFATYIQYIFLKSGQNISAEYSSMIFAGLCVLFNLCAGFLVERLGRQKSFSYSAFFCGVLLFVQSTYFYLDMYEPQIDLEQFRWVPLGGLVLFDIAFCFGIGIIPTLMLGELFSQSIKGKGLCVLNIVFGLLVSSITKLFQVLETNFGMWCPFLLFSVSCFMTTVLTNYFVPETKGRTLEEIQQGLKGNDPKKKKTQDSSMEKSSPKRKKISDSEL